MNLGVKLLCKLGLTESEAEHINDQENANYIFARDQGGIGYTYPKLSLLPDLDSTFARLAAISNLSKNDAPKLEIKPVQNRYFIPNRLKKKDINSLSNEDLSSIFIQSNSMAEQLETISNNLESPRKKRHHRHHNQKDEVQDHQYPEQIESPIADNLSSNFNQAAIGNSCQQNENTASEVQVDSSENVSQKKHRRRHHRNKTNEQSAVENT